MHIFCNLPTWFCSHSLLYSSTMATTRPHFPAEYTCPPSTAIASASLRCTQKDCAISISHECETGEIWDLLSHVTMILLMQSSTVLPSWHSILMLLCSLTLMMVHMSHLLFSAWPTVHHVISWDLLPVLNPVEQIRLSDWVNIFPAKIWYSINPSQFITC